MFDLEPLTEKCKHVLSEADHVCIGISPFNSYFSTRRIAALAGWAMARFGSCHFFVPDAAAVYTLQALGYPAERARHKAARQGAYVHNKVATALTSLGVARPEDLVWGARRLAECPRYQELHDHARRLFDTHDDFRDACLDASRWVLDRKLPDGREPTGEQLLLAVRYFLAELPMFTDSAAICLGGPGHSSLFVYHQRVRFLERFYRRELAWHPVEQQGFLVVTENPLVEQPV
ncbi:tRNA-dependent cyclodipeptide synthase [Streptomyces lichenis]|uniref:tRNA-dependent cyclodipeptide synthase n=1 Tax=Streptomyces lichenis TaxID=2306967 RepID=UPI0024A653AD|nr:tRNA-dependent cyclodipeptide synthase [Streptomyces lichenis]